MGIAVKVLVVGSRRGPLQKEVRDYPVPDTAVPAGSAIGKTDPPCTKAEPGRGVSGASAEIYLRKGDKCSKHHQS